MRYVRPLPILLLAGIASGCGAEKHETPPRDTVKPLAQRAVITAPASAAPAVADSAATTPEPKLSIAVTPSAIDIHGDTVRVTLNVRNLATSNADLWMFTVDAPVPVLTVEQLGPGNKRDLDMGKEYGISVATWAFLGDHVAPGGTAPPVAFSATGLPGIVRYWAERWIPPDTVETADEPPDSSAAPVTPGPWNSASDSGVTIGVLPFPADRSRGALVTRMRTLLQDTCARHWIDDADTCSTLDQKLEREDTSGFLEQLGAQRAKHVNELAYFLLVGNVRALPAM